MYQKFIKTSLIFTLALFVCLASGAVRAQNTEDLVALKQQASTLIKQQKFTEALPIIEKLVKADPGDADAHFYLGFALLGQSVNTTDKAARKTLRVRARDAFVKSKELGNDEPIVDAMISSIPPGGGEEGAFSENDEANSLMEKAEAMFAQGKLDEALAAYQKALQLDPKIYEAALFSGDVYKEQGKYDQAEIWYQKAIAINPDRETAYRYSATPLMLQKKYDQARDRYIEAYITEPYSRFPVSGLSQWAQATGTRLGHPKVDLPEITYDDKGKANSTVNVNPLADDGSMAWMMYVATRGIWRKEKFAKTFPKEKTYRHTLQEEADALRSVISAAKELKGKTKNLNSEIAVLMKLDEEGLLESFILLALPDKGIAADHPAYLKQNRDKMRQYMLKYVIGAK